MKNCAKLSRFGCGPVTAIKIQQCTGPQLGIHCTCNGPQLQITSIILSNCWTLSSRNPKAYLYNRLVIIVFVVHIETSMTAPLFLHCEVRLISLGVSCKENTEIISPCMLECVKITTFLALFSQINSPSAPERQILQSTSVYAIFINSQSQLSVPLNWRRLDRTPNSKR
ncbi:hypothetical protein Mapa_000600 [Marchantia paleacea]|nr:hypothetical protein Mapa_000600 [Marchantia paleacea]